jgi:hypothetical protein
MWRCVDPALTDVSEERNASIFTVEKSASGEPASAGGCRLHHRPYPSPLCWFPMWPTLPLSLFLYSWLFPTGGSVCSHLLTLVRRSRIFLPWRWRRHVPPKRRSTQDLQSATSQKTKFFRKVIVWARRLHSNGAARTYVSSVELSTVIKELHRSFNYAQKTVHDIQGNGRSID